MNNEQLQQQVAQGTAGNAPTNPQQFQQIAAAESNGAGGNALIVAAQDPSVSDEFLTFADDATNGSDAVPSDLLGSLPAGSFLKRGLAYVRHEVPHAVSDALKTQVAAAAWLKDSEELSAMWTDNDSALRDFVESFDVTSNIDNKCEGIIDQGSVQTPDKIAEQIADWETARGRHLFTTSPIGQNKLSQFGGNKNSDGGILQALQHAREWSLEDRTSALDLAAGIDAALVPGGDSIDVPFTDLRSIAEDWGVDASNGMGPSQGSALSLSMTMNESVQTAWDDVVILVLTSSDFSQVGNLHKAVSLSLSKIQNNVIELVGREVPLGAGDLVYEYAIDAAAAGTPASTQAQIEVAQLGAQATAAASLALSKSLEALEASSNARMMGQKVFFEAAAVGHLKQAAQIAGDCQAETAAILGNANEISRIYLDTHGQARNAGRLPPQFNSGRSLDDGK